MEEKKPSRLDMLDGRIHSPEHQIKRAPKRQVQLDEPLVINAWDETPLPKEDTPYDHAPKHHFLKALFYFALIACILSLGYFGYKIYQDKNFVSVDNIIINVIGPKAVGAGDVSSFDISVQNKNNSALIFSSMRVDFPNGTKKADSSNAELAREKIDIGTVLAQKEVRKNIQARIFGAQNSTLTIRFTLEYRVPGSNAIYEKAYQYPISIGTVPLTVSADILERVNSGQEQEITVTVESNTNQPLPGLLLQIEYPFGFKFTSANPLPTYGSDVWEIGTLAPGSKKTIKLRGVVIGQDADVRTFGFSVGTASARDQKEIGALLAVRKDTQEIDRPFLDVSLALNGDESSSDYSARRGETIRGVINWQSTSETRIADAVVELRISGPGLDKRQVVADSNGYYDSTRGVITWNNRSVAEFVTINPEDKGQLNFNVTVPRDLADSIYQPFVIEISVRGNRSDESGAPVALNSVVSRRVQLVSELALASRATRAATPFTQSGTIPPQADKETTYTVVWTVTNTRNQSDDVVVRAILPTYVKWKDLRLPENEPLTFNERTGEVIWNIGTLEPGVGFGKPARTVSFQLGLKASINQVGQVPDLLTQIELKGVDHRTQVALSDKKVNLTTRITTDPGYRAGDEVVKQ